MHFQYSCSQCHEPMEFDKKNAILRCRNCNITEEIPGYLSEFPSFSTHIEKDTYDDEQARQYVCNNCHAVLVTDNHTSLEKCYFCGQPMHPGERMSGDFAPTRIIPFSISYKEAKKSYRKWRRNMIFAPKEYGKQKQKAKLVGLYLPFWLYDMEEQQEAFLHTANIKKWKEGKEKITETSRYELYRQADLTLKHIPQAASGMFSKKMLEKLMPYDYTALKKFSLQDLNLHHAEQYNSTQDESLSDAKKQADHLTDIFLKESAASYQEISIKEKEGNTSLLSAQYTLLPVWTVRYDYRDSEYTFLMNGQTGKVAGNPPLSLPKLAVGFGLIATFLFIFLRIFTALLGGPVL